MRANDVEGIEVKQPKTEGERREVARTCATKLKISIPIVVDGLDNAVDKAYGGWPVRMYVVGKDGKIAYQGKRGPRGFKPKEGEEALKKIL